MTRSRALAAGAGVLQLVLERITARIAVSELARKVQVEHLGGGAVEIPNGVAVAQVRRRPSRCRAGPGEGGAIGFLGRFTEPRKGFPVLLRRRSSRWPRAPARACGCWSPGRATPTTLSTASRPRCATGSRSWAWSPRRTRRGCCAASTSTWRRTPAASRSA